LIQQKGEYIFFLFRQFSNLLKEDPFSKYFLMIKINLLCFRYNSSL